MTTLPTYELALQELKSKLTPQQLHQLFLKMTEDYHFDDTESSFHMCKVCHQKEYERGGSGTETEFHYCEECEEEMCIGCILADGDLHSYDPKSWSFVCGDHLPSFPRSV